LSTRAEVSARSERMDAQNWSDNIGHVAAWLGACAVYVFLYAPLLTIAVFAFNDSTLQSLPWAGFTTRWFSAAAENSQLVNAMVFGLTVSTITVVFASTMGLVLAAALHAGRRGPSRVLLGALVLPAVVPGLVLGLSLAIAFRSIGVTPGLWSIVFGHLTFTTPVVTLIVLSRLKRLDPSLVQASMDLGAGRLRTFRHVTWPQLRSAVLASAVLCFTLSFDEVIVTYFLVGNQATFPVYVWTQTRFGFTPEINAVVTLIASTSVVLIVIATRLLERDIEPSGSAQ